MERSGIVPDIKDRLFHEKRKEIDRDGSRQYRVLRSRPGPYFVEQRSISFPPQEHDLFLSKVFQSPDEFRKVERRPHLDGPFGTRMDEDERFSGVQSGLAEDLVETRMIRGCVLESRLSEFFPNPERFQEKEVLFDGMKRCRDRDLLCIKVLPPFPGILETDAPRGMRKSGQKPGAKEALGIENRVVSGFPKVVRE